MFALWCVPVHQNAMKSVLTTSLIGMLLTKLKKKNNNKNAVFCMEITQFIGSLCMVYGYSGHRENPKPVYFTIVNN